MNTATTLLHDMRGQQLLALVRMSPRNADPEDMNRVRYLVAMCDGSPFYPETFSTRNLSDKSLEELDTLSGKYFDRIR